MPVVLAFDELVYVSDSASIAINDKEFTPNDLHMSKAGNQLMFWYPVQKVDGAEVTITSLTGIMDIFGNAAEINGETAAGAETPGRHDLPQTREFGIDVAVSVLRIDTVDGTGHALSSTPCP